MRTYDETIDSDELVELVDVLLNFCGARDPKKYKLFIFILKTRAMAWCKRVKKYFINSKGGNFRYASLHIPLHPEGKPSWWKAWIY